MTELRAKLQSHVIDGESQLIELHGMCSAAMALVELVIEDDHKRGGGEGHSAVKGLFAVVVDISDRVTDLQSWHTQLHEIGVIRAREAANG